MSKRTRSISILAAVCVASIPSTQANAQRNPDWTEPFPPFRIVGNLYYVGTKDLASYLITTPEGHILINSNLKDYVPLIQSSVEKLGFKFADVKVLLISHAHPDHDGGSAEIKRLTGAKYMVMDGDASVVESGGKSDFQYGADSTLRYPVTKVDRVLHDGDRVTLGGTTLVAHLTPGHTKGCTTWTMQVNDSARAYNVVIVGSPNVNQGYRLVDNAAYPEIVADYERTFRALKSLPVDLFLGAHGSYFDLGKKYSRMLSGDRTAFNDPVGYANYVREREHAFRQELQTQTSNSLPLAAQTSTAPPPATRHSQIILFGTGTPIIDATHSGPSIGILIAGSLYIFDAGPGVERRMLEAVAKGTRIDTIPAVFITHLHSDHTLGLPALVYYHGPNATFRRGGPLTIYGPPGIAEMMDHINAAWAPDRAVRSRTGGAAPSWQVRGADVSPGIVYRDSNIVVKAFEVPHTVWPHAYGYRVEAPDRTIVISGDTRPTDAIARECAGCDVLLHEVYSAEGFKKIPARVQPYHSSAHTSTYELAEIATKAQPKLLVLYHELYFSGATEEDLLREIRSRYAGRVVAGHDLDVY
ncbi:MAG TPA: subclass B3 metallo-beta-lactamase [Gemmatimonadaceae bacterium]|nr:subclass B3 metallo-beta-lactamase [Gemmatimonadaceae bacterium]